MKRRTSKHEISPIILNRKSFLAMSGEPVKESEFLPLFEAARWAPSSYNNQHWRFVYAKRDTKYWDEFFDLLGDWNKGWCKNAALLVIVVSKKTSDRNNNHMRTHSFDTGAAWQNLALEGTRRKLVVHGMEGFDYERAKKLLNLGDNYNVEAMIAIGKPGKKEHLAKEYHEAEDMISERKPLNEIMFEGRMRA